MQGSSSSLLAVNEETLIRTGKIVRKLMAPSYPPIASLHTQEEGKEPGPDEG